jgi:hypothetical protein
MNPKPLRILRYFSLVIVFCSHIYSQNWFPIASQWNQPIDLIKCSDIDNEILFTSIKPNLLEQNIGYILRSLDAGVSWDTLIAGINCTEIEFFPTSVNQILVSCISSLDYGSGLLFSDDLGESWVHRDNGLFPSSWTGVTAISIDKENPETWYAGTGGIFGGNFYRSEDSGSSWISKADQGYNYTRIEILYSTFNQVFVASTVGLLRYNDSTGFVTHLLPEVEIRDVIGLQGQHSCIIIRSYDEISRSIDGGITWELIPTIGYEPYDYGRMTVWEDHENSFILPTNVGFLFSTNLGSSWNILGGNGEAYYATSVSVSIPTRTMYGTTQNHGIVKYIYETQGVESINRIVNFRVAPNPFANTIRVFPGNSEISKIRIYDLLGRPVNSSISLHSTQATISMGSEYDSGIYVLIVWQGSQRSTAKINYVKH